MHSFCVELRYTLFAMVFSMRPAILGLDPSNTSSGIPGFVFKKHPLGSNILPFSKAKVHRYTPQSSPPALPFGSLFGDGGALRGSLWQADWLRSVTRNSKLIGILDAWLSITCIVFQVPEINENIGSRGD